MESPVQVTDSALEQMDKALAAESERPKGIRFGVVGGGCAGFQYAMNFENDPRPGDTPGEVGNPTLFIDKMSISYLAGCEIDWVSSPMGAGFKFLNPNVTTTCGCGSSFS